MNRADRRKNGIHAVTEPARSAVPPAQLFGLLMVGRAEHVAPDGTKFAMTVFHVMTGDGTLLVEQTPNGPAPIAITSQPIAVGRSLVVPGGTIPRT